MNVSACPPWKLDARTVDTALSPWGDEDHIVTTPPSAYAEVLRTDRSLNLGAAKLLAVDENTGLDVDDPMRRRLSPRPPAEFPCHPAEVGPGVSFL